MSKVINHDPKASPNDDICSICHEILKGNLNITLECSHIFHKKCIENNSDYSDNCPLCRTETALNKKDLEEIQDKYYEKYGMTLCKASLVGNLTAVKDMVKHGVPICECALSQAVYGGHYKVVEVLIKYNATILDDAITIASAQGSVDMFDLLIKQEGVAERIETKALVLATRGAYGEFTSIDGFAKDPEETENCLVIVEKLLRLNVEMDLPNLTLNELKIIHKIKKAIKRETKIKDHILLKKA